MANIRSHTFPSRMFDLIVATFSLSRWCRSSSRFKSIISGSLIGALFELLFDFFERFDETDAGEGRGTLGSGRWSFLAYSMACKTGRLSWREWMFWLNSVTILKFKSETDHFYDESSLNGKWILVTRITLYVFLVRFYSNKHLKKQRGPRKCCGIFSYILTSFSDLINYCSKLRVSRIRICRVIA